MYKRPVKSAVDVYLNELEGAICDHQERSIYGVDIDDEPATTKEKMLEYQHRGHELVTCVGHLPPLVDGVTMDDESIHCVFDEGRCSVMVHRYYEKILAEFWEDNGRKKWRYLQWSYKTGRSY